jgi:histidinol phosphatase-like enzyme
MVGDSVSDLEFGRNIGTKNIYIQHGGVLPSPNLWDEIYASLSDFQVSLHKKSTIYSTKA